MLSFGGLAVRLVVLLDRNANGPADHKETQHYLTWRETVAEMMETPRTLEPGDK